MNLLTDEEINQIIKALPAVCTHREVIHGDADFSEMNEGLVDYFKKSVAAMKESA